MGLQAWRFVAFKAWIITGKQQALQSISLKNDVTRDAFSFDLNEFAQAVDRFHHALVNLRIVLSQLDVVTNSLGKNGELLDRISSLVGERHFKRNVKLLNFP